MGEGRRAEEHKEKGICKEEVKGVAKQVNEEGSREKGTVEETSCVWKSMNSCQYVSLLYVCRKLFYDTHSSSSPGNC